MLLCGSRGHTTLATAFVIVYRHVPLVPFVFHNGSRHKCILGLVALGHETQIGHIMLCSFWYRRRRRLLYIWNKYIYNIFGINHWFKTHVMHIHIYRHCGWYVCFHYSDFVHSSCRWIDRDDYTLQWCHNERDGFSNHRRLDYLLNLLFRRRSKKTSKLRVIGIHRGPVNSSHKEPVTRKIFPFDDVIMRADKIQESYPVK